MLERPSDPDPERVFDTLDDRACREIVESLDQPMTAREISERADIPLSTTYKKLDRLESADLLEEETELDPSGHHRSRYVVNFDRIVVLLDEQNRFSVGIESTLAAAERQLVDAWAAVRRET